MRRSSARFNDAVRELVRQGIREVAEATGAYHAGEAMAQKLGLPKPRANPSTTLLDPSLAVFAHHNSRLRDLEVYHDTTLRKARTDSNIVTSSVLVAGYLRILQGYGYTLQLIEQTLQVTTSLSLAYQIRMWKHGVSQYLVALKSPWPESHDVMANFIGNAASLWLAGQPTLQPILLRCTAILLQTQCSGQRTALPPDQRPLDKPSAAFKMKSLYCDYNTSATANDLHACGIIHDQSYFAKYRPGVYAMASIPNLR